MVFGAQPQFQPFPVFLYHPSQLQPNGREHVVANIVKYSQMRDCGSFDFEKKKKKKKKRQQLKGFADSVFPIVSFLCILQRK